MISRNLILKKATPIWVPVPTCTYLVSEWFRKRSLIAIVFRLRLSNCFSLRWLWHVWQQRSLWFLCVVRWRLFQKCHYWRWDEFFQTRFDNAKSDANMEVWHWIFRLAANFLHQTKRSTEEVVVLIPKPLRSISPVAWLVKRWRDDTIFVEPSIFSSKWFLTFVGFLKWINGKRCMKCFHNFFLFAFF